MPSSFSDSRLVGRLDRAEARDQGAPVLEEDRAQDVVLRGEVVVEQAVRDAGVLGDVADARAVVAVLREDANRGVEDALALVGTWRLNGQSTQARIEVRSARVQPLAGTLVVDFTRYLPGAYASRELRRLGARVVRVEPPGGDPMRPTATAWDTALRAGSESVVCDLPADATLRAGSLRACRRRSRGLPSRRRRAPGRWAVATCRTPRVYCSITGFGLEGRHVRRAGHDVNYLGWAGALEDTAPGLPPIQIADLAAGALGSGDAGARRTARARANRTRRAARRVHDASLARPRRAPSGRRARSAGCSPVDSRATACTGRPDGRQLTVGALEPKFFERLCELVGRPELAERQYDADQDALGDELAAVFVTRSLADWLAHFGDEDVCVGPVWTREEAAAEFGSSDVAEEVPLGAHTDAWRARARRELARAQQAARAGCRCVLGVVPAARRGRAGWRASRAPARPRCRPRTSRPTITVSSGRTSSRSSATRKIDGVRLDPAVRLRPDLRVDLERGGGRRTRRGHVGRSSRARS